MGFEDDEPAHGEDWTPEKEKQNDPMNFAREYLKEAKKLLQPHLPNPASLVGMMENQIIFRRIQNGYVIRYQEPVKTSPPPGFPPGSFNLRYVETYVKDFTDAGPVLQRAMAACEDLEHLAQAAIDGASPA